MKLTKIEVYEIQAFAFRVMTGYMAPGKDASPLADETPYEGRCAAWDEWRNEHAPCILAMLHGFEALIDRDDGTTRALLARLDKSERENERLREDAERYRWLRGEHQRIDPICAVVWKRNGDRNGSEWVNTADLDADIDAARAAEQSDEV